VGGLTTLTMLPFYFCSNMTDAVLWEQRGLTALTHLDLHFTSTTKAGLDALKAALPALTIH